MEAFLNILDVYQQYLVPYYAKMFVDTFVLRVNATLISQHPYLIKLSKEAHKSESLEASWGYHKV